MHQPRTSVRRGLRSDLRLTRPRPAVFERFAPKLASASIDHRVGVLRCSTGARSVGDVIVKSESVPL